MRVIRLSIKSDPHIGCYNHVRERKENTHQITFKDIP